MPIVVTIVGSMEFSSLSVLGDDAVGFSSTVPMTPEYRFTGVIRCGKPGRGNAEVEEVNADRDSARPNCRGSSP